MTKSGQKHVYRRKSGWYVEIRMKSGIKVSLPGTFKTVEKATAARDAYLLTHEKGAGHDQWSREGFRYIYGRLEYADKGEPYTRFIVTIPDRKTGKFEYIGSSKDIQVAIAIRDAYLAKNPTL